MNKGTVERPGYPELDELTLARAKRGDRAAQGKLIETYSRAVYALVGRMMIGQREWVDDIAQDVFVKVMIGLNKFDPRGRAKLSTWILTVASRTCIDVLRRNATSLRVAPELTADAADQLPVGNPETQASQRQITDRISAAMASLTPDQRAILILRAFHDLDYHEIAESLGLELGTVKSRLGRARETLRAAVETEANESER